MKIQTAKHIVNTIIMAVCLITPGIVAMAHLEWSQDMFVGMILLGPFLVCFLLLDWYRTHLSESLAGCISGIGMFSFTMLLIIIYNSIFCSIPVSRWIHLESNILKQMSFRLVFVGCIGGTFAAIISIPRIFIFRFLETSFHIQRRDS